MTHEPNCPARKCLVPNGRVGAYIPLWIAQLVSHPGEKVGWAAVGAVWAALLGSVSVVAIVAFAFWVLDFVSGTIRALRDPDDALRWEKAGDAVLKLGLYIVVYMVGVLGDILVAAAPPHIDTHSALASVACAVIISMEIASIRKNIVDSMPRTSAFFDRLAAILKEGSDAGAE